jgi:2,4-dienoyl-CoA reductase-like NADH-dependent reductase (Old Yellow Enzyme family)
MSMGETSVAERVRTQPASAELLFRPYKLGPLTLPHRIVMAPLTRSRARQPGNVPTSLNACYYAQRAYSGKPNSVFHSGGTAVVIHDGKDDYMTDPAGNAGNRIACGVIK